MFPYADILYDQEVEGSGLYMPYLQEPEHCHANSAVLWELHALRVCLGLVLLLGGCLGLVLGGCLLPCLRGGTLSCLRGGGWSFDFAWS